MIRIQHFKIAKWAQVGQFNLKTRKKTSKRVPTTQCNQNWRAVQINTWSLYLMRVMSCLQVQPYVVHFHPNRSHLHHMLLFTIAIVVATSYPMAKKQRQENGKNTIENSPNMTTTEKKNEFLSSKRQKMNEIGYWNLEKKKKCMSNEKRVKFTL